MGRTCLNFRLGQRITHEAYLFSRIVRELRES
jgi:hypothetical protein